MTAPKPGDVRLLRMRKNLGEWTLRCPNLTEAVWIADEDRKALAEWPSISPVKVQWFTADGWADVPEVDLEAARREP